MPTYCYKTDNNEVIERIFPMGQAPDQVVIMSGEMGSVIAKRYYQAEGVAGQVAGEGTPDRISGKPKKPWPMACVASGVHPSQAKELGDHLAKHGVPTEVNKQGDPVYTSASHRKRALKARGFFDKN